MTTLPELLREADPVSGEPRRGAHERSLRRDAVVNAPGNGGDVSRRSMMKRVVFATTLIAMAGAGLYWSRASVDVVAAVRFEVRLAEEAFAPGLREAAVGATRKIYLHPETVITNSDIADASVVPGSRDGEFSVAVTFKADGAERMRRATQNHIGKPVAMLIDGTVVMAPVVRSAIGTQATLTGSYAKADAERIAAGMIGR